jgi:hypothetical protein
MDNKSCLEFIKEELKNFKQTCPRITYTECSRIIIEMLKDIYHIDEGTDSDEKTNSDEQDDIKDTSYVSNYYLFVKKTITTLRKEYPGLSSYEYTKMAVKLWNKLK